MITALGYLGARREAPALAKALASSNPAERGAAALAAGRARDSSLVVPLAAAAKDSRADTRARSVCARSDRGPARRARRFALLGDKDPMTRAWRPGRWATWGIPRRRGARVPAHRLGVARARESGAIDRRDEAPSAPRDFAPSAIPIPVRWEAALAWRRSAIRRPCAPNRGAPRQRRRACSSGGHSALEDSGRRSCRASRPPRPAPAVHAAGVIARWEISPGASLEVLLARCATRLSRPAAGAASALGRRARTGSGGAVLRARSRPGIRRGCVRAEALARS